MQETLHETMEKERILSNQSVDTVHPSFDAFPNRRHVIEIKAHLIDGGNIKLSTDEECSRPPIGKMANKQDLNDNRGSKFRFHYPHGIFTVAP